MRCTYYLKVHYITALSCLLSTPVALYAHTAMLFPKPWTSMNEFIWARDHKANEKPHFNMVSGQSTMKFDNATQIHNAFPEIDYTAGNYAVPMFQFSRWFWFTNYTFVGGTPSIADNSTLRTFRNLPSSIVDELNTVGISNLGYDGLYRIRPLLQGDWTANHPWRAPGAAYVFSPCGVFGGNKNGCKAGIDMSRLKVYRPDELNGGNGNISWAPARWPVEPANGTNGGAKNHPFSMTTEDDVEREYGSNLNHYCPGGGYPDGIDGRELYDRFKDTIEENMQVWKAGTDVDVAWEIHANHGGGHLYRICKMPASGNVMEIKESDFRELRFVKGTTRLVYFSNGTQVVTKPGWRPLYTDDEPGIATVPAGSLWQRNPIPAGYDAHIPMSGDGNEPQFPPPAPGLWVNEATDWLFGTNAFPVQLWDKVHVPEDLTPGEYVVSWRYDAENSAQVWCSCSSVRIIT